MVKLIIAVCVLVLGFFAVQGWTDWYHEHQTDNCVKAAAQRAQGRLGVYSDEVNSDILALDSQRCQ